MMVVSGEEAGEDDEECVQKVEMGWCCRPDPGTRLRNKRIVRKAVQWDCRILCRGSIVLFPGPFL